MSFSFLRDKDFFRAMLALALPVAFQQFITAGLNMIDVLMVGQLGKPLWPRSGWRIRFSFC
jgi:Na+-driven multidrug efflux pump